MDIKTITKQTPKKRINWSKGQFLENDDYIVAYDGKNNSRLTTFSGTIIKLKKDVTSSMVHIGSTLWNLKKREFKSVELDINVKEQEKENIDWSKPQLVCHKDEPNIYIVLTDGKTNYFNLFCGTTILPGTSELSTGEHWSEFDKKSFIPYNGKIKLSNNSNNL